MHGKTSAIFWILPEQFFSKNYEKYLIKRKFSETLWVVFLIYIYLATSVGISTKLHIIASHKAMQATYGRHICYKLVKSFLFRY